MTIRVLEGSADGEPIRIGVWSPDRAAGYFVVFGPPPTMQLSTEMVARGGVGRFLTDREGTDRANLGTYDSAEQVALDVDRSRGVITASVMSPGEAPARDSITSSDLPALFASQRLAVTASTTPLGSPARVELSKLTITLPHERFWADKVDDPRLKAILAVLGAIGLVLMAIALVSWLRERPPWRPSGRLPLRAAPWVVGAVLVYLIGNVLLFPLGSHPFDMGNERLFAYVARVYGPDQLFYLPSITSLAQIWSGVPLSESSFPYGPVLAYLSTAIGWVAGPGIQVGSAALTYWIKAVNVIFGALDAGLIYLIARHLAMPVTWRWIVTAAFLFNPAVWFSMSLWGQTHVISLFFVLACVLFIERRQPFWAWVTLFAACMTRPQMLVFGLVLGLVLLRLFPWRQTLESLSLAVVVTFLLLLPLTWKTSASLPFDTLINNLRIQEGGGSQPAMTTASLGAYSIWPFITYALQGASGMARSMMSSSLPLIPGLSYQRAGQLLTAVALGAICLVILLRDKRSLEGGWYLPLVAAAIVAFLMLLTATVPTHFVLAIPFLLLLARRMSTAGFIYIAVAWSATTFFTLYGAMVPLLSAASYPVLAPARSAVSRFFAELYVSDRFITVGVLANLFVLFWLAAVVLRHRSVVRETAGA